jgi:uncharacterized protein (TIGR03435 family)
MSNAGKIERAGRKILLALELVPIVAASLAVTSFAQAPSSQTAAALKPGTPAIAARPAFEVSTVKPNKSGSSGSDSYFRDGRFTASNVTLKNLLQYRAYRIPASRIFDGPKWIDSEGFDVEAKTDGAVADWLRTLTRDQLRVQTQGMFQQLLADRFKLAVHWETRDLPVYAMVVAKNGPILHPSQDPDGGFHTSAHDGQFTAQNITAAQLADALTQELSRELGRVVIDKTGIQGKYDVSLKWVPESSAALISGGTAGPALPPNSGPSIFTAIQEQLGLKLKSAKAPVQVLVVDHAEMPSEN